MAKVTKKSVKRVTRKAKVTPLVSDPLSMPLATTVERKPMNNRILSFALVAIALALLIYKLGPWLAPVIVDSRPLTRFELWSRLEKIYGAQTLDDMVNERILNNAIAKSGVKIEKSQVEAQLKTIETQFESSGGIDEALKQRGLSRSDLEKQISTQLSVEALLADKIEPTEEEVKAQFEAGATTLYKDKKLDDVKESIAEELKQTKLREAFLTWFADVKKEAKVKSFGI